jgi:mRNA-degrading endonuclease RelE of RelBE toxin-antitoxin system
MRFEFKPSFEDSLKSLPRKEKEEIKEIALFAIDILSRDRFIYKGIGLKRLKGDYWEIRKGLKTRIILHWSKDLVEFLLAGTHDQIRRYLGGV